MKKIILLCFMFVPLNVLAYESNTFSIEIPENMKEVETLEHYKWIEDNEDELPNITLMQVKNNGSNIDLFDDKDVLAYEEYVQNELNESLEEFDVVTEVYDSNIKTFNNRKALVYKTKMNTMDSYGYDIYQIGYVFTTKNYLTSLIISDKDEDAVNNKYEDVIESLNIKDEDIEVKNHSIVYVIGFAFLGGFIGLLISMIINKKGRRK